MLNQSLLSKHFVPMDQRVRDSPANLLEDSKEWGFGQVVSGTVTGEQGGCA